MDSVRLKHNLWKPLEADTLYKTHSSARTIRNLWLTSQKPRLLQTSCATNLTGARSRLTDRRKRLREFKIQVLDHNWHGTSHDLTLEMV